MFNTRNIILAGLFAAMVTVGTMIIQIPVGVSGYIHLGDSMIYLSGVILGPVLAPICSGLGSFLADMMSGYAVYAVPTFIIKGLDALVVALVYRAILGKSSSMNKKMIAYIVSFVAGTVVMCSGYFLFETIMYGMSGALLSLMPNIFQGVVGGVLSVPVFVVLTKINFIQMYSSTK